MVASCAWGNPEISLKVKEKKGIRKTNENLEDEAPSGLNSRQESGSSGFWGLSSRQVSGSSGFWGLSSRQVSLSAEGMRRPKSRHIIMDDSGALNVEFSRTQSLLMTDISELVADAEDHEREMDMKSPITS